MADRVAPMASGVTPEALEPRPGLVGFRISATEATGLDWPRLDEAWALAGESGALSAGWLSDDLSDASRDTPPVRRSGPSIWPGGQKRRGIALAVRYADGWPMPGYRPGDVAYVVAKRDEISRALDAAGRGPAASTFAARLTCGVTPQARHQALEAARAFVRAGANHVILGLPASAAPAGLAAVVDEVAEPLLASATGEAGG